MPSLCPSLGASGWLSLGLRPKLHPNWDRPWVLWVSTWWPFAKTSTPEPPKSDRKYPSKRLWCRARTGPINSSFVLLRRHGFCCDVHVCQRAAILEMLRRQWGMWRWRSFIISPRRKVWIRSLLGFQPERFACLWCVQLSRWASRSPGSLIWSLPNAMMSPWKAWKREENSYACWTRPPKRAKRNDTVPPVSLFFEDWCRWWISPGRFYAHARNVEVVKSDAADLNSTGVPSRDEHLKEGWWPNLELFDIWKAWSQIVTLALFIESFDANRGELHVSFFLCKRTHVKHL